MVEDARQLKRVRSVGTGKKGLQKLVNLCEKVEMAEEKRGFIQGVLKGFCINFINLLYHQWK